jgi:beta-lactam-binding protein with PASTA domain
MATADLVLLLVSLLGLGLIVGGLWIALAPKGGAKSEEPRVEGGAVSAARAAVGSLVCGGWGVVWIDRERC